MHLQTMIWFAMFVVGVWLVCGRAGSGAGARVVVGFSSISGRFLVGLCRFGVGVRTKRRRRWGGRGLLLVSCRFQVGFWLVWGRFVDEEEAGVGRVCSWFLVGLALVSGWFAVFLQKKRSLGRVVVAVGL